MFDGGQGHITDGVGALTHHQRLGQQRMQAFDTHRHAAGTGAFDVFLAVFQGQSDFDAETKQLMADYKLIQYDITTGKNYLKDTSFMDLP